MIIYYHHIGKYKCNYFKRKTYEEINEMFNMLNNKLNASLEENKRLQEKNSNCNRLHLIRYV